jgi:starvation-inducible DNA-binding protein
MVDLLNDRLAELIDLTTHVKEAHWHLRGPAFIAIHEFLDEVAGEVGKTADEVAERALQLGGRAHGLVPRVAKASRLPAYPEGLTDQADHVKALTGSLTWCADRLRASIDGAEEAGDAVTADLFTRHPGSSMCWRGRSAPT